MLYDINNFIKEYEPLIKLIWAIFPFAVTIIMAYIAYQQYKLVQYKEYCEFIDKFKNDFKNISSEFEKSFEEIINSSESGKIKKIVELVSSYEKKVEKYEECFDATDIQFIKTSYNRAKEWFLAHDKFEWNWFYIKNSFNVITDFLVAFIYAKGIFLENPMTRSITLYTLIGVSIKKIICFFIPLFIQKIYKKHIRPIFFKIKAIWYIFKFLIYLIKVLFFNKEGSKNKSEDIIKNAK